MVKALIDYLNAPGVVPLQRVVDNFDGNSLNERWNFNDVAGTGSGAMSDTTDGGYAITTGATFLNASEINFNGIEHYANTGSKVIGVIKNVTTTDFFQFCGLYDNSLNNQTIFEQSSFRSNPQLETRSGGSQTLVATSLSFDANWKKFSIDINSTSHKLAVNDVLEAVSTSNLPAVALAPFFRQGTRASATRTGHIRYLEAFNV